MVSDEEEERCGALCRRCEWKVTAVTPLLVARRSRNDVTARHDGSTTDYTLYVTVYTIRNKAFLEMPFLCG